MQLTQPLKYTITVVTTLLLTLSMTVFAAPFNPGDTLDPSCNPGDFECYVEGDSMYTSDGTLTSDRFIDIDERNFSIGSNAGSSSGDISITAGGSNGLYISNASLGTLVGGSVVGNVAGVDYAIAGTLSPGTSAFLGASNGVADTNIEVSPTEIFLRTQNIATSTATNGQALVLSDASTGEVEFATVGGAGTTIVEIADIDFNDINAYPSVTSHIETLSGVFPANSKLVSAYAKVLQEFDAPTFPFKMQATVITSGDSLELIEAEYDLSMGDYQLQPSSGIKAQRSLVAQDVEFDFRFDDENNPNPQDYTQGQIKIYVEVATFPTLP